LRTIISGLSAILFSAIAGATPITLTFAGTGSGTVNGTAFTNQTFDIVFTSDTTALCTIGAAPCPMTGAVGDITTPDPTANTFTIGSIVPASDDASLTGIVSGPTFIGPAVFLNPMTNNVGIWTFNNTDWLVTVSSQYTTSFGLANDISVTGLSSPPGSGAFGNQTQPTQLGMMGSTVGAVDFTALSNVSFTEAVMGPAGVTAPEPSTLLMFGLGALGIALGRLRKRA
jgi:PEP-CTERM motif